MRIRKANPADAAALYAIKQQLPMPSASNHTQTGGFLLGTDEATYQLYLQLAHSLVAENEEGIKGFGIIFPDALIRQSALWQKRHQAAWHIDVETIETKTLCYFEQLAFLPGHRKWSSLLSYLLLKEAFDSGCEYMITTIVKKPIHNKAAIPLIEAVGGKCIGHIDEEYPVAGAIHSEVYGIDRNDFYTQTVEHRLFPFVMRMQKAL